ALQHIEKQKVNDLIGETIPIISCVKGDFRQEEIVRGWKTFQKEYGHEYLTTVKIVVRATSGTYMRSLAEYVGTTLGIPALAYRIVRTHVGDYTAPNLDL